MIQTKQPENANAPISASEIFSATRRFATPGKPLPHDRDLAELVGFFRHWVFVCVRRNAESIAETKLRLYVTRRTRQTANRMKTRAVAKHRQDELFSRPSLTKALSAATDIEEVTEHPILELLRNVNGEENRFDLFEKRETFLQLVGNAYWYIVLNRLNRPLELRTLPAHWVRAIPGKDQLIQGYRYGPDYNHIDFDVEEVIRFTAPSPMNIIYGYPELAAVTEAVELHDDIWAFDKSLLKRGAVTSAVVLLDENASKEEVERAILDFNQRYAGPNRAGKVWGAKGIKDIKPVSIAPRDLNHSEGRRWIREVICGAFGVPLSMVTVESVNRANAEAGNHQYAKYTLVPRCRRAEEAYNQDFVPLWGDDRLFMAFDNPVPDDKELRLKQRQTMIATGGTINQQNEIDGLPPVEGGDVPLVPKNLWPLATALAAPASGGIGAAPPPPPAKERKAGPEWADWDDLVEVWVERKAAFSVVPTRDMKRAVAGVFAAMERDMLSRMKGGEPDEVRRVGQEYNFADLRYWLPDTDHFIEVMHDKGKPHVERAMFRGADMALDDLPQDIGGAFNVEHPLVQEHIAAQSKKFSSTVVKHEADALKDALGEGIKRGESIDKLRKRTMEVFGMAKGWQAERIARTETLRAFNAGHQEMYRQSGVVEKKEWSAAADCCELCAAMNGTAIGLTDSFGQTDYGIVETPPLHPNCRCRIIPVLTTRKLEGEPDVRTAD